jgi:DNA segregation ATPase FtsK/SpoIIIE, S-DNA-T family
MGKAKVNRRTVKAGGRNAGSARTGMRRDIAAVGLLALGVALGVALLTFSSLDTALVAHGVPPASNLVGPVGHFLARVLFRALGYSALVLPVAVCTFAVGLLRGRSRRITLVSTMAYLVLTAAVATLGQLFLDGQKLASFPPGGAVGRLLCGRAVALFSSVGTGIVLGACALVALIVATDLKVQRVAAWAVGAFRSLFGLAASKLGEAVAEHREAVAELRAEELAARAQREAEAAELAASALVEATDETEAAEARAVAGALAREQVNRPFAEPAWAQELRGGFDDEEPVKERRRRAKPEEEPEDLAGVAEPSEPEAMEEEPEPAAAKPEIVLSEAMAERGRRKKKEKEIPSFAFTQKGEVFKLPSLSLLDSHPTVKKDLDESGLQKTAEIIVATLRQHGVEGTIRHIRPGPVVTLYEFSPIAGVKLAKIENLDKELTMALSATRIRIIAPIPGKGVVGIEVPNKDRATVYLREVLESETFAHAGGMLPLALGKNIEGVPYCVDLQRMPHLLVAGTTGAGKSVGLNTMILSLLYRQTPDEVRLIMVDPKMTELTVYEDIPHLLLPVVTDPQKATRSLQWAVDEMERRTQILADTGSKDLKSYNSKVEKLRAAGRTFDEPEPLPPSRLVVVDVSAGETEEQATERLAREEATRAPADGAAADSQGSGAVETEPVAATAEFEDPTAPPPPDPVAELDQRRLPQKLPYIVCIIDELADLMMTAPREVEISLARLAQKARATGIHLMVATQRPSTDVITGMIKNNFPARISFRLASRHDSATIINGPGAETLLGDGDMLVMTATQGLTRAQGCFVSEDEIRRVVAFLKEQGRPVYDESILKAREGAGDSSRYDDEDDPVYDEALALVARMEEVSVSKLQREMRLGYNKAAKIIERMEREGIVGPPNGVKPRQVLIRPAGEVSAETNV